MAKNNRDRLDGTKKGSFLYELFMLPGRIVLWFNYMSGGTHKIKGYRGVAITRRQARSPIVTFIVSLMSWVFIGVASYAIINDDLSNHQVLNSDKSTDTKLISPTQSGKDIVN